MCQVVKSAPVNVEIEKVFFKLCSKFRCDVILQLFQVALMTRCSELLLIFL